MEYKLIRTKEKTTRYILESGEKLFSINDILFEILTEYKNKLDYEEISIKVNKKFNNEDLTNKEMVEEAIAQVKNMISDNEDSEKSNYINNRIKIMTGRYAERIYSFFSFLYSKYLFITLSTILTMISIIFFNINEIGLREGYNTVYENLSLKTIVVAYIFFFVIIYLHEMGHATATYYFGEKPKEIGFGIYFIFPVLYTDTTNIWKLNKNQRIVVNLGGIYVQLIINTLLIGAYYMFDNNILIKVLIIMNTVSMITSFNPFFRYDGYWIYSDLFQISNLKEKTSDITKMILFQPKNIFKNIKIMNKALLVYAILNFIFWIMISYSISLVLITSIENVYRMVGTGKWLSFPMIRDSILLIMIGIFIYNTFNKLNLKKYEK